MQSHTEFRCDPAQDRRAGRTGQQRLELEAWPFVALRGTQRGLAVIFEWDEINSCLRGSEWVEKLKSLN